MRHTRLLVAALSCIGLSACAGGGSAPRALPARDTAATAPAIPTTGHGDLAARLARAPAATAESGSARTSVTATVTGVPGRTDPITFRGDGVIDFAAGRSRSVLGLDPGPQGARASDLEIETVAADGLLYVRSPALAAMAGTSVPWARLDPTPPGGGVGAGQGPPGLHLLTGLAGGDLGAPLALLAGVDPSSVHEVGTETTGDGDITRLRATADPVAATGATAARDRTALEAFLDALGARRLRVEVALDQDDRLRRLVYEHDAVTAAGVAGQRFEVEYFDLGTAVEVNVPPPDQVRELTSTF